MKRYFHFTCRVCGQEFDVPYYEDHGMAPPEMLTVMEHEDAHIAGGETIDWGCEITEKEES